VDHQAVAEAVDALVREKARAADVRIGADLARTLRQLVTLGADERALDDAVVIAGPARGPSVRQRLRDAAFVMLERRGADRMGDPVAVGLDRLLGQLLLEEVERRLWPLSVRDVSERLAAAVGVEAAL
jgi:hypothetical protein